MAKALERLEVSARPDLLSIAEEVKASGIPRVLERNGEAIAVVTPLQRAQRSPGKKSHKDSHLEDFLAAAGSWSDVDIDSFLADVAESRQRSSRPLPDL